VQTPTASASPAAAPAAIASHAAAPTGSLAQAAHALAVAEATAALTLPALTGAVSSHMVPQLQQPALLPQHPAAAPYPTAFPAATSAAGTDFVTLLQHAVVCLFCTPASPCCWPPIVQTCVPTCHTGAMVAPAGDGMAEPPAATPGLVWGWPVGPPVPWFAGVPAPYMHATVPTAGRHRDDCSGST
jgi:hypothetical protein